MGASYIPGQDIFNYHQLAAVIMIVASVYYVEIVGAASHNARA